MASSLMSQVAVEVRPDPPAVELLGVELLEEHARGLAALFVVSRRPIGKPPSHLERLRGNLELLRGTYRALAEDARRGETPAPAMEWFLDNFHVVSAAGRDILRDLPSSFFRRLPRIAADEFEGVPRIYALALELLRTSAGHLDAQRLSRFITAFQSVTPLTIGELWAWPSALKVALIEHLRVRADVLAASRMHRHHADRLANALERTATSSGPWPEEVHPAFVTRLLQHIREYGDTASALRDQLGAALAARGTSVEEAIRDEGRQQAVEQASMANLFGSLRLIAAFDWSEFFESVSVVEQVLRRDPARVYSDMDFQSRDRYRHAVEELAEPTGEAQHRVALKCVENARRRAIVDPDALEAHVGYYLIGHGRQQFERSVDWTPNFAQRLSRLFYAYATPGYLGTIAAVTLALVMAALMYASRSGADTLQLLAVLLLGLIPASEFTIQLVQHLVARAIPPRRLPRLELDVIPTDATTMVIVPTMLIGIEQVQALVAHLEVQALGNVDPHVHFALLTDVRDAEAETLPHDEMLLAEARTRIAELNARHGQGQTGPFHLFHRRRQWNESERLWMGWERKRGKIEEFNRLLRGATDTSFVSIVGDLGVLTHVRYCITLDSDTRLPRDAARQLIGIIAHPLNRPILDPVSRRVTSGYGILQPRISVTSDSAAGSLFARLYSGHTGVDPYTTAVSDTYQDLFGEGIFTGKGLYVVDAFTEALAEVVPENALLSHDLFEGLHARVALVSDIELVDDYPSSVLTHARRQHRWIRGDWQILLWLFPFVPSPQGLKRNTLPLISRWKILDNLRRSLLSPMLLLLLVAGWTVLPGAPWIWTLAVMGVLASQLLPTAATLLTGPRRAQSTPVFLRNLGQDAMSAVAQIVLSVTFLAFHAFDAVHAIALTLLRLGVTRRRLLEWETAAAVAARTTRTSGPRGLHLFSNSMISSPVVATVAALAVVTWAPSSLLLAAPFLFLWLAAPAVAYRLSVPVGPRVRALADDDRTLFRLTARKTWRYFETFVNEADGWLASGQRAGSERRGDDRRGGHRRRTSAWACCPPWRRTTSASSPCRRCCARVDRTLTTLEGLERYRGHFLNWYDTATRAPLQPRYVSTVDSGNLAGALGALAYGLRALTNATQTVRCRLDGLADAADLLALSSASPGIDGDQETTASIARLSRAIAAECRRDASASREESSPDTLARLRLLAAELRTVAPETAPAVEFSAAGDRRYWMQAVLEGVEAIAAGDEVASGRREALGQARHAPVRGDRVRFSLRPAQAHLRHRLPAGRCRRPGQTGRLVLRPARVGGAPGQLRRHRERATCRSTTGSISDGSVTGVDGRATLVSWGGTMFEYLMPMLLMRTLPGTLLDQSCRAAVRAPDGLRRGSGRPLGHLGIGLRLHRPRRQLSVQGVWRARPRAEARTVRRSGDCAVRDRARGAGRPRGGGREHRPPRRGGARCPVRILRGARLSSACPWSRRRVGRIRPARSGARVLRPPSGHVAGRACERAVRRRVRRPVPCRPTHAGDRAATAGAGPARGDSVGAASGRRPRRPRRRCRSIRRAASGRRTPRSPHTQFLSNGRYTIAFTNAGGGYSTWRDLAITRRRDDRTSDAGRTTSTSGTLAADVWSPTLSAGLPATRQLRRHLRSRQGRRSAAADGDSRSQLEVTVSSEDDVEVRRLTVTNRGTQARELEVTSYVEIVLARPEDDLAHPAFGKLFVETEFDPQSAGLLFSRRPRRPTRRRCGVSRPGRRG